MLGRLTKKRRAAAAPSASPSNELRTKNVHDRQGNRSRGMPAREADATFQAEYRIVPSSEITDILPQTVYGSQVKDGRVTTRSDWKDISKYYSILSRHFPDYFEKYPQIANFLLLESSGKMAAAALHQIQARVCEGSSEYTKLFLVNGMVARLSPVEFSLVSGLRFVDERTDDERNTTGDLKSRMFPKYQSSRVPLEKLAKKIDRLDSPGGDKADLPNLVFVWLISNVLLLERTKYVSDDIFELCSDLDICEKYPWGLSIWKATVEDCLNAMGPINGTGDRNWNTSGFPFIVVYWMLETIEGADVALKAAVRPGWETLYPRMLRWRLSYAAPSNNKFSTFLNRAPSVCPRLKPDSVELQSGYFYQTLRLYEGNVHGAPDSLRIGSVDYCTDYVQFRSDHVPEEVVDTEAATRTTSTSERYQPAPQAEYAGDQPAPQAEYAGGPPDWWTAGPPDWWATSQRAHEESATAQQAKYYDALMAQQTAQQKYYDALMAEQANHRAAEQRHHEALMAQQANHHEAVMARMDDFEKRLGRLSIGRPSEEFMIESPPREPPREPQFLLEYGTWSESNPEGLGYETPSQSPRRNESPMFSGSSSMDVEVETTEIKSVRDRRPSHYMRTPFFGVSERPDKFSVAEFMSALNSNKTIQADIGYEWPVDASFFREMSSAGVNMTIYHVDAVLSIMHSDFTQIMKQSVHPSMEGRYTIVPTTFFQTMLYLWDRGDNTADGFSLTPFEDLDTCIQTICVGVDRWGNPTPWFGLQFVLTVVNVGMHYVTCKIDLQNEVIFVYDSIRHRYTPEIESERKRVLLPLTCWLPPMLNHAGIRIRKNMWRMKFVEQSQCYDQDDNTNCGAFALAQVVAILTKKIAKTTMSRDIKQWRVELAKEVFRFSCVWTGPE